MGHRLRSKKALICFLICSLFMIDRLFYECAFAEEKTDYLQITGPCNLSFPIDHQPHPGYRTEWWYYTGNLEDDAGNRYGFQLTFFRSQISPSKKVAPWPNPPSAWRTRQIYLGHAALSDINGKQHLQAEIMAREALGMASVLTKNEGLTISLNTWSMDLTPGMHHLKAYMTDFSFELYLSPEKPPILHGVAGYSRKGTTPERASCYYSFTRLETTGILVINGNSLSVKGSSWMDHEFSSAPLEPGLAGWDWFSLQLSDQTEIMIYLLRKEDGRPNEASSGTYVDTDGNAYHLTKEALEVGITDTWKSPGSMATYPSGWRIRIPSLSMTLSVTPTLSNQEMRTPDTTDVTYWEGSVDVTGTKEDKPINGSGYVELTGYAKPFDAPM